MRRGTKRRYAEKSFCYVKSMVSPRTSNRQIIGEDYRLMGLFSSNKTLNELMSKHKRTKTFAGFKDKNFKNIYS